MLNQIIEAQFREAIGEKQIENIGKLTKLFPGYDELTVQFTLVKTELETIKSQLEQSLPKLADAVLEGINDLGKRAGAAHAGLTTSIGGLETRDREISEKLVATLSKIDSQLEAVQLQAATVSSMQEGIHGLVAKQQQDMERVRLDVERSVANAIATIAPNTQPSQGPGEQQGREQRDGGGGRLNDPKKCEVDAPTDNMSKVAFCLRRDNLDLYLEEFPDLGWAPIPSSRRLACIRPRRR